MVHCNVLGYLTSDIAIMTRCPLVSQNHFLTFLLAVLSSCPTSVVSGGATQIMTGTRKAQYSDLSLLWILISETNGSDFATEVTLIQTEVSSYAQSISMKKSCAGMKNSPV